MKRIALLVVTAFCFVAFAQAQDTTQAQTRVMKGKADAEKAEKRERVTKERVVINGIANLTQEQRDQMKKLRVDMMKESNGLRNQIAEKSAHLKTLQCADNADMKAINKTIDEIASLQAQQMKAQANMQVKVRALLTDEQKVMYDARGGKAMRFNFNGRNFNMDGAKFDFDGKKFNFDGKNGARVRAFRIGDAEMPNGEELNKIISEQLANLDFDIPFDFDFDFEE